MSAPLIKDIEDLYEMLAAAIQLEHATIPVYLTALYSLHSETNLEANQIIRAVLIEEMLHMTLSANVLNAVGGTPDLLSDDFMPAFPTYLPDGEKDFKVPIASFSKKTLETFLKIERPNPQNGKPCGDAPKGCIRRDKLRHNCLRATYHKDEKLTYSFYSIGDFYEAILDGIRYLEAEAKLKGGSIFTGDPALQVDSKFYYSGGGEIIQVYDLKSATEAIHLIQGQGEGYCQGIFDQQGELSHYYRFEQLKLGQFYHVGDEPGHPTGEKFQVDWDAMYSIIENPRVEKFSENKELYDNALVFNKQYKQILGIVNRAYNGEQQILLNAVPFMFRLKEYAITLTRNPIDQPNGPYGGPTFETNTTSVKESHNVCLSHAL